MNEKVLVWCGVWEDTIGPRDYSRKKHMSGHLDLRAGEKVSKRCVVKILHVWRERTHVCYLLLSDTIFFFGDEQLLASVLVLAPTYTRASTTTTSLANSCHTKNSNGQNCLFFVCFLSLRALCWMTWFLWAEALSCISLPHKKVLSLQSKKNPLLQ